MTETPVPTPQELREIARQLGSSYPSVRQHAARIRAAAARLEELEGRETLNRFERRATKRKRVNR